jgi:adenine-specific DNA-methyltransferase
MELNKKTQEYLNVHLKSNKNDWYGFGRTQALNDTFKEKIIISCLIKSNPESLKILKAQAGIGVYSGIYILTNKTYEEVKKALVNPLFINFVESLKKYKNGGYYTFNTSDVQKYLNYYFEGGRCE